MTSVCTLAALLVVSSAANARTRHRPPWRCQPHRPDLVAANRKAEVFAIGYTAEGEFNPERFDGCAYGSTHAHRLGSAQYGSSSGQGGSGHYTLAGATVAYAESRSGFGYFAPEPESDDVIVVDLSTGRRLHDVATGTVSCGHYPGLSGVGPVRSLVLKQDGAVAWIAEHVQSLCSSPRGICELHALDSHGERVLAIGPDIDPHSLTLLGSTIYWKQGGRPFSGKLM